MGEFWEFVKVVFSHWQAYVTGGGITAVLQVWERLTSRSLSKRTYAILVLVGFLLVAFFLAWRDQYQALQATRKENTEIYRQLLEMKQIPLPKLESIRFIPVLLPQSPYQDTLYGIKIVVQTNIAIQPFELRVKCNVPLKRGNVEFPIPQALINMHQTIYQDGSNTFEYGFRSPAFIPENPLILILWSDQPITACQKV